METLSKPLLHVCSLCMLNGLNLTRKWWMIWLPMAEPMLPTFSSYTSPLVSPISPMGKLTKKPSNTRRLTSLLPGSWSTTTMSFGSRRRLSACGLHSFSPSSALLFLRQTNFDIWRIGFAKRALVLPSLPVCIPCLAVSILPSSSYPVWLQKRLFFGFAHLFALTCVAWIAKEFKMWFTPFSFCSLSFHLTLQWCAQPYPTGNGGWLFDI